MDAVLDAEWHAFQDRARLALLQPAHACLLGLVGDGSGQQSRENQRSQDDT